jgi:triosephosphate isomerase
VQTLVDGDRLEIGYGAQDVSAFDAGAYTGDISAKCLSKLGCQYVVVGHSERRRFHGEDDNIVNAKTLKAASRGIIPIVCVGEGLAVRSSSDRCRHLAPRGGRARRRDPEQIAKLVIAYEPVWAIGTGRVATPEDAEEVCGASAPGSRERHGDEIAEQIRILYGGSVNATNVAALMEQPDIDGCLVGGASLKVDEFAAIARFYEMPMI